MTSVLKIFEFEVSMECPERDIEAARNVYQRFEKEVRYESTVLEYLIIKEEGTKKRQGQEQMLG